MYNEVHNLQYARYLILLLLIQQKGDRGLHKLSVCVMCDHDKLSFFYLSLFRMLCRCICVLCAQTQKLEVVLELLLYLRHLRDMHIVQVESLLRR